MKKKILYICGSLNQTTMMHKISAHLNEFDNYFTPYFADGYVGSLEKTGLLNFTILGGQFKENTLKYLNARNLQVDSRGSANNYDLIFTCSDLIIPKSIRGKKLILVQEGMTDPEGIAYHLVKYLKLPRYMASTSATGLSDAYDYFCVASEGYKELFIRKGVKKEKLIATGIPNFDDAARHLNNDFPHKHYVLAATSDTRETFKYENRKKFISHVVDVAGGRKVIFKLHPNENVMRATEEINKYAPEAIVYSNGNTNHMIANCDVLITRFSSVVYIGIALGKEVHSEFNLDELKRMTPIQNGGASACNIALLARKALANEKIETIEFNGEHTAADAEYEFAR
ncbi:MAG TPA: hypothetical protein VHO28_03700 [Ignavibacteriales bacterium]|nr:hypothetical protein [Ignavibacteriales bacterium]